MQGEQKLQKISKTCEAESEQGFNKYSLLKEADFKLIFYMRKLNLLLITAIAICLMIACGDSTPKEKTLSVSNVSFSGQAKQYLKVVDGDYILKPVEGKVLIGIKFELIRRYDLGGKAEVGNINLIPLDKSGIAIADIGLDFKPASLGDWDKLSDLLVGTVGETVMISFEWNYFSDKEKQKRIMQETVNFEIVRGDFTGTDKAENVVSGTGNLDKALEALEKMAEALESIGDLADDD
jgi:hypothetical protein